MPKKRAPARNAARRQSDNAFWLDHAEIVEEDIEWLASVERLVLWNVSVPPGFLARLEKLWWLDVRGGSATDLRIARGATKLQYLAVNQIRGLCDLSVIREMIDLRYVLLYGLPHVTQLPSFLPLSKLEHASVGQLRGLLSLSGLLEAPHLRELEFVRKVNVTSEDVSHIITHPTIKQFSWFAEDVPDKVWVPVVKKIGLPPLPHGFPEDWFSLAESSAIRRSYCKAKPDIAKPAAEPDSPDRQLQMALDDLKSKL
jgi:hypothetical protein